MDAFINISPDVRESFPDIRVKTTTIQGLDVKPKAEFITARRKKILNSIREKYTSQNVISDQTVQAYRSLYYKIGIDPDETPPSVQALITRFIKTEQFPNINSVVDCVNLATLESMIPLGVFDLDHVIGEVVLRYSQDREPFLELGKKEPYELAKGKLVIADSEKVLSVFYWRDSEHQKITEKTKNIAVLACQVEGISDAMIDNSITIVEEIIKTSHPSK